MLEIFKFSVSLSDFMERFTGRAMLSVLSGENLEKKIAEIDGEMQLVLECVGKKP
jgi:hypothetical protein